MSIYLVFHISFMSVAVFCVLMGAKIAFLGKRGKWSWLPVHRLMAFSAVIFSITGFIMMVISKTIQDYSHFNTVHSISGLVFTLIVPIQAVAALIGMKGGSAMVRTLHRLTGSAILLLGLWVLVLGYLKFA